MARQRIQQANPNLDKLSKGSKKKVLIDVIDNIKDIEDLKRDKNNIIIGSNYRLDAKPMAQQGNGFLAGDYKLDIQTVTTQKSLSTTVAIVYLAPLAPAGSLDDVTQSFNDCMETQDIYRVE